MISAVFLVKTKCFQITSSAAECSQAIPGGPSPATAPGPSFPTGAMPMPEPALSHGKSRFLGLKEITNNKLASSR